MTRPKLAIVVAVAKNGVIGAGGDLPWRIPSDLKRFKAATLGKPVIMGRKTWESLPRKPLPGRANIIVSRSMRAAGGAQVVSGADAALDAGAAAAAECGAGEICLIGGAQLYADMLARVDRIYLTEVDLEPQGDAVFPQLDPAQWREISAEPVAPGEGDDAGFTVRLLERRSA
ncbi:MAG: dihydrofolate reductase [Oceanicaulis sp.]